MRVKTSELTGSALDWAVAIANGYNTYPMDSVERGEIFHTEPDKAPFGEKIARHGYKPSTDWSQGGQIIELKGITLDPQSPTGNGREWRAALEWVDSPQAEEFGPTPLIAAMRCYVASKLGDEVEVPDDLNQGE